MKIWIVNIVNSTNIVRAFTEQKDYDAWLKHNWSQEKLDLVDNAVVTSYEASVIESNTMGEIRKSIRDSNNRESRIEAIVSEDPWFIKFEKFKVELTKYSNTQLILEKLNMIENQQKIITRFLKANKEFLLCDVSDSVEWFELIISMTGIKKMVECSYRKINGYNTKVVPSQTFKDNFLKAKENLKSSVEIK
jgi:hypothetical protein